MKYIFLFLFLPLLSFGQLSTTYDSYFQTITDNETVRIYHVKMVINVTEHWVEIKSKLQESGLETCLAKVMVEWQIGAGFLMSSYQDRVVFYYPKINKLVIINEDTESIFYGNIPTNVEIAK